MKLALEYVFPTPSATGIHTWTQILVHDQLGSSGQHCTKWADNQLRPAGLSLSSCSTFPSLKPPLSSTFGSFDLVSSSLVGGREK